MVQKKIVLSFVTVIGVLLIVGVVSAGVGDWLKSLFGEPQLGPFNASVNVQGVAPRVIKVINITDRIGSLVNQVDVTEGGVTSAYVIFVAHDDNSEADLPSGAGIPLGQGIKNINISLQKPLGVKPALFLPGIAGNTICNEVVPCNPIDCPDDANERMYLCNMTVMQFYYENRSDWFVNVTVTDGSGLLALRNDTKTFQYLPHLAIDNSGNITWESVSVILTNQRSSTNLTLTNKGNVARNFARLTAFNLTGNNYPTKPLSYLPASAFSSNGTVGLECSSTNGVLAENVFRDIGGFLLDYGLAVSTDVRFCIYPALNSLGKDTSDISYNARGNNYAVDGTKAWEYTKI